MRSRPAAAARCLAPWVLALTELACVHPMTTESAGATTGRSTTTLPERARTERRHTRANLPSGDSTLESMLGAAFGARGPLRIMMVGDSTANCLGWGLRALQSADVVVELEAKDGCQLLDDTCEGSSWARKASELHPRETVVFVGGAFLYGMHAGSQWQTACHAEWNATFERHLSAHLRDLANEPTRVWAVTIPYPLGEYDDAARRAQVDCINASIRKSAAAVGGVEVLDLAERLCPKGACIREEDGKVIRPDGVHFAIDALAPLSRWVLGELRR